MSRAWLAPVAGCVLLAAWLMRRPRRLDGPHPQRPVPRLSEEYRRLGVIPEEPEVELDGPDWRPRATDLRPYWTRDRREAA